MKEARAEQSKGFDQIVELLRGPTDERRFVGLLLASKVLPTGDEAALQAVYKNAGPQFFKRLLLPLQRTQQDPLSDPEGLKKAAATCALGLTILASLCRSPVVSASPGLIESIPLFLKVVKRDGVSKVLGSETITQEAREMDENAVQDALECTIAISSASEEAKQVAMESNALVAICAALQHHGNGKQWAVRLLISLLDTPHRRSVVAGDDMILPTLVPALASLLGSEGSAAQARRGSDGFPESDPAALQLETLHALLLLLPAREGSEADAELHAAAEGGNAPWLVAARSGLHILLRAKLGPSQRQAVLQLTAALSHLAPSAWLQGGDNFGFFTVVVELVKVEIILLLRDALSPDSAIAFRELQPSGTNVSEPPATVVRDDGDAHEEADADDSESDRTPLEDHILQQSPLELMAQNSRRIDEMAAAPLATAGPREELAGGRAERNLPALLGLFEGCVEALAEAEEGNSGVNGAGLPERVASRAMTSLAEAGEAMIQFLEELQSQSRDELIATAVVRALGRLLAEAPSLEGVRMRRLLPWLTHIQTGAALPYLLPWLLQVTAPEISDKEQHLWCAAVACREVLRPLEDRIQELTSLPEQQDTLYYACAVLANVANATYDVDRQDAHTGALTHALIATTRTLSPWVHKQLQLHNPRHPGNAASFEPRLLAYVGCICAWGLTVSSGGGGLSGTEVQTACQVVLTALEVSDVIVTLNANQPPSHRLSAGLDLSSLFLNEIQAAGKNQPAVSQEMAEDLADEVRLVSAVTLRTASTLIATVPQFKAAALHCHWYLALKDRPLEGRKGSSHYITSLAAFRTLLT